MKIFRLLFLLLIGSSAFGQLPKPFPRSSPFQPVLDYRLHVPYNLDIPHGKDTTNALNSGQDSLGLIYFDYLHHVLYVRDTTTGTHYWYNPVNSGGGLTGFTTIGTSGLATYSGGILNIPNYTQGPFTVGQIPFANGTYSLTSGAYFLWDNTNLNFQAGGGNTLNGTVQNMSLFGTGHSIGLSSAGTVTGGVAYGNSQTLTAASGFTLNGPFVNGSGNYIMASLANSTYPFVNGTGNIVYDNANTFVNGASNDIRGATNTAIFGGGNKAVQANAVANSFAAGTGLYLKSTGAQALVGAYNDSLRSNLAFGVGTGTNVTPKTGFWIDYNNNAYLAPGNTAARPSSPSAGMFRFNSDSAANKPEYYNGSAWVAFATGGSGGASSYSTLSDVSITSIANNQLMKWNSGTSKWNNFSPGSTDVNSWLGYTPYNSTNPSNYTSTFAGATDVSITSPVGNQIPVFNSSTGKWNNQSLPPINVQNGLNAPDSAHIYLGGRLLQNTSVSLANSYEMKFDSAQAGTSKGFVVNFGSDAGWDMSVRDSATGHWTRIPKGTVGQSLQMLSAGGIGWANQSGASGGNSNAVGQDSVQSFTSGSTVTQNSGYNVLQVNPSSVLSSLTITTATAFHSSNKLMIVFGGTITSGNPVVTTLTITAGSGLTLVQSVTPTTAQAGEVIEYKKVGSYLYRIN